MKESAFARLLGVDPHLAGFGNMVEELAPNQKGQPAYDPDPNAVAVYIEDEKPLSALPAEFQYSSQFYVERVLQSSA